MSEAKFTPGPWESSTAFRTNDGSFAVTAPDSHIAFVTFHGKAKRGQAWCTGDPEGQANANLIAAAPEMYEALKIAQSNLQFLPPDDVVAQINAALAKADGK